jgi:hypothetical protein
MSTLGIGKPSQAQLATALCKSLGVPVPSFKPHKRNPRERVNPLRRAKRAIREAYGLDTGRSWVQFKRWVLR